MLDASLRLLTVAGHVALFVFFGAMSVYGARKLNRTVRLYWRHRGLEVTPIKDVVDGRARKVAAAGEVEPIDGDGPVYLQVERQRLGRSGNGSRHWNFDSARIVAEPFHLTDGTGTARVEPEWLRRRHDSSVGDSRITPGPSTSPYLHFDEVRFVEPDDDDASAIYDTFDAFDDASDTEGTARFRYRVAAVRPGDDVYVGGVPVLEQGVPVFRGGEQPLVLADVELHRVRRSLLGDCLRSAFGTGLAVLFFLVVSVVGLVRLLTSELGQELLLGLLT